MPRSGCSALHGVSHNLKKTWQMRIVNEVNGHEGDSKITFLHPHGFRKTFSWQSVTDVLYQHQTFYALSQLQQPMGKCIRSQTMTLNKL